MILLHKIWTAVMCMHVAGVYEHSMFHILRIYGLLQMDGQSVVEIMPIENEQVVNNGYYWSTIDTTHSMAYPVITYRPIRFPWKLGKSCASICCACLV